MENKNLEKEMLKKLAELNIVFGAGLNADIEWQKKFVFQEYIRVRTEIFDLIRNYKNETL